MGSLASSQNSTSERESDLGPVYLSVRVFFEEDPQFSIDDSAIYAEVGKTPL